MAKKKKKKKKKKSVTDRSEMSKSELKAHNKEVCAFYEENGWRATIGEYRISPKELSEITEDVRDKAEEKPKPKKRGRKKGKKVSKKKAKRSAKKAPKKKAAKKVSKRRGRPPKAKTAPSLPSSSDDDMVLDYLLAYRNKKGESMSLDEVIIQLTTKVRKAA